MVLDNHLLSRGEGAIQLDLYQACRVLVVDDVFITGTKLDAINRFFREQRAKHAPQVQRIYYWTLLATPPSEAAYRRRLNGLTAAHGWAASVEHLYAFPLPDWHLPVQCPWCREKDVLQAIAQHQADFDGPIAARLAKLAAPEGISTDPYFLADAVAQLPTLGAQSAVLPVGATSVQVLFACASAVQQLRHATKRLDVDQFPSPVFLASRVFAENYTERIIWLALLRSVRTRELEQSLRTFLQDAALNEHDPQRETIQNELIIAWLIGKLDAIPLSVPCKELFESAGVDWDALFQIGLVDGECSKDAPNS